MRPGPRRAAGVFLFYGAGNPRSNPRSFSLLAGAESSAVAVYCRCPFPVRIYMHKRKRPIIKKPSLCGSTFLICLILAVVTGCSRGPEAGTVYGPVDTEENLYIDLTAEEAEKLEQEEKILPEAEITESGFTVSEIDESDVYPPKKTDENGEPLPAYLVDYAVKISNADNELAMVWPTVTAVAYDIDGNKISTSKKTIRTYVLPGDEIAFGSEMTVRGNRPASVQFSATSEDPETYYPTEEELDMPASDSYRTGEVSVRILSEYEGSAPSAGRKSSDGLSNGYFKFGELPELSGTVSCSTDKDQEAFVTILYRNGDEILGGETGRVMIPAGKEAAFVLSAAAPVPEDTESFEVTAFSIAVY